jgi:hypothetical protein
MLFLKLGGIVVPLHSHNLYCILEKLLYGPPVCLADNCALFGKTGESMKMRFCIGFVVHQPYRLKKGFKPDFMGGTDDPMERYILTMRTKRFCSGFATNATNLQQRSYWING